MFFNRFQATPTMRRQCAVIRANFIIIQQREARFRVFLGNEGWEQLRPLLERYQEILIESVLHSDNDQTIWENRSLECLLRLSDFGGLQGGIGIQNLIQSRNNLKNEIYWSLQDFKDSDSITTKLTLIDKLRVWRSNEPT